MLPPRRPDPSSQSSSSAKPSIDPDDAIRLTDDDAAASRLSATSLGYLDDPYVSLLYKPAYDPIPPYSPHSPSSSHGSGPGAGTGAAPSSVAGPSRKPPLINIGTHHRTYALDLLVDRFLKAGGKQIISLGAGSDTRFWRLMSKKAKPELKHYVEIDFANVTSLKAQRIARSPKLTALLSSAAPLASDSHSSSTSEPSSSTSYSQGPIRQESAPPRPYTISQGGTALSSARYSLLPLDLRRSPQITLDTHLLPLLDPSLPTLFLAECVFCYMPPPMARDIIGWFGSRFERCVGVVYEMCGLDDTFGKVMKRNLASRNLSLPGSIFANPQAQAERFLNPALGVGSFQNAGAKSLWQIREEVVGKEELQRLSKLEFLDEIEELRLVLSHYCIAWGSKGEGMGSVAL